MTPTEPAEVTVREALPDEADTLADLYSAARRAAVPHMPPAVHTDEEHRGYYRGHVFEGDGHTVWVAVQDAGLVMVPPHRGQITRRPCCAARFPASTAVARALDWRGPAWVPGRPSHVYSVRFQPAAPPGRMRECKRAVRQTPRA